MKLLSLAEGGYGKCGPRALRFYLPLGRVMTLKLGYFDFDAGYGK